MKKKLGKAHSLPGERWLDWLNYMKDHAGAKYFLVLYLTCALCVRATQAARLTCADFHFKKGRVWVARFKKHPGTFKTLLPSVLRFLKEVKRKGIKSAAGSFKWPKDGFLFPSRKKAKAKHMSKDVLGATIRRHRTNFLKAFRRKYPDLEDPEGKTIRSHSGRRHCISKMVAHDMSPNVIMGFAQIESYRVFKHYVDTDAETFSSLLSQADRKLKLGKAK